MRDLRRKLKGGIPYLLYCIAEFWKIKKVVLVSLDWERKLLGFLPRPTYKHRRSYQTVTAKYDRIAMR